MKNITQNFHKTMKRNHLLVVAMIARAILTLGENDFTEEAFTVTYPIDGGQALIRRFFLSSKVPC